MLGKHTQAESSAASFPVAGSLIRTSLALIRVEQVLGEREGRATREERRLFLFERRILVRCAFRKLKWIVH